MSEKIKAKMHRMEHICIRCGEIIGLIGNNHTTECPECGNIGLRDSNIGDIDYNNRLKRALKKEYATEYMKKNACTSCMKFSDCEKMKSISKKMECGERELLPAPNTQIPLQVQKTIIQPCEKNCKLEFWELDLCPQNKVVICKNEKLHIPKIKVVPPCEKNCKLEFWELDLCPQRKKMICPKEEEDIKGINIPLWEKKDGLEDYNYTPELKDYKAEIQEEYSSEKLIFGEDIVPKISQKMSLKKANQAEKNVEGYIPSSIPATRKERREKIEKATQKQEERQKLSHGLKLRDKLIKLMEIGMDTAKKAASKLSIYDWQAIQEAGGIPKYIVPQDDGEYNSNLHL